ncbi:MAG: hypothetical protein ACTSWD_16865 [Candidatus Heimdallarchaeota archaeon]|jgi:hypothetical protein
MIIKNLISRRERELVFGIKKDLYEELKGVSEYDNDLNINKRFIEIRAMIGLCKKLLG